MAVVDHTASSGQLCERWSIATGVSLSIPYSNNFRCLLYRGVRTSVPLYKHLSCKAIGIFGCNGLIDIDSDIMTGLKLHFR